LAKIRKINQREEGGKQKAGGGKHKCCCCLPLSAYYLSSFSVMMAFISSALIQAGERAFAYLACVLFYLYSLTNGTIFAA
jgi:hypothetical protein